MLLFWEGMMTIKKDKIIGQNRIKNIQTLVPLVNKTYMKYDDLSILNLLRILVIMQNSNNIRTWLFICDFHKYVCLD